MEGALISPNLSEIIPLKGEDLDDALASFWSDKWQQGWDPDQKILNDYGDWIIYQKVDGSLVPSGELKAWASIKL